jgi:hypothetical protein
MSADRNYLSVFPAVFTFLEYTVFFAWTTDWYIAMSSLITTNDNSTCNTFDLNDPHMIIFKESHQIIVVMGFLVNMCRFCAPVYIAI